MWEYPCDSWSLVRSGDFDPVATRYRPVETEDEYGLFLYQLFTIAALDPEDVEGVVIASVVPPLTCILEKLSRRYFDCEPVMIHPPGWMLALPCFMIIRWR